MKYTITVEETLTYEREVVVDVPDDIDEDSFDEILDTADRSIRSYGSIDELYSVLESHDIKVLQTADDDMNYPINAEYEITEFDPDSSEDSDEESDGLDDEE